MFQTSVVNSGDNITNCISLKVFDKRKNALWSMKGIRSSEIREEDVEFKEEVDASNDDFPLPRPSTSAAALQEAGSPALNLDDSW